MFIGSICRRAEGAQPDRKRLVLQCQVLQLSVWKLDDVPEPAMLFCLLHSYALQIISAVEMADRGHMDSFQACRQHVNAAETLTDMVLLKLNAQHVHTSASKYTVGLPDLLALSHSEGSGQILRCRGL